MKTITNSLRHIPRLAFVALTLLVWSQPAKAQANQGLVITEVTDFYFQLDEPGQFLAQTFQSGDLPSDPQLWLYNSVSGELLVTNDDYLGLQSKIDLELQAGSYRLRAATCCGNPDDWRDGIVWNVQYELSFDGNPLTTTTTTIWLPTTTFTEPTTTTSTTVLETTVPATTEVTTSLPLEASTTTTLIEMPTSEPTTTTTLGLPSSTTLIPQSTSTSTTTSIPPIPTATTSLPPETTTSIAASPPETEPPAPSPTEIPDTEPDADIEIGESLDPEVALALATDTERLLEVTADEAAEIFDAIVPEELSETEAAAIIAAVQDAPDEIRNAFQEEINIYSGTFDQYVPLGSVVNVQQRRSLIAAMTTISVVVTTPTRKR